MGICRFENEYEEAKKKTKEKLQPLKAELADLEDQVRYKSLYKCLFIPIYAALYRLLNKLR
jgi:hypothetical protein